MWVHSVDCHPYHDYIIMILSMWADAIHFDLCTVWPGFFAYPYVISKSMCFLPEYDLAGMLYTYILSQSRALSLENPKNPFGNPFGNPIRKKRIRMSLDQFSFGSCSSEWDSHSDNSDRDFPNGIPIRI